MNTRLWQLAIGHNVNGHPALTASRISRTLSRFWDGYTTYDGLGRYNGYSEKTTIVQLALTPKQSRELPAQIRSLCRDLRQNEIMVTRPSGTVEFIGGKADV